MPWINLFVFLFKYKRNKDLMIIYLTHVWSERLMQYVHVCKYKLRLWILVKLNQNIKISQCCWKRANLWSYFAENCSCIHGRRNINKPSKRPLPDNTKHSKETNRCHIPKSQTVRVCGRSLAGIAGSNPVGGMDAWSLTQDSPAGECDQVQQSPPTVRIRRYKGPTKNINKLFSQSTNFPLSCFIKIPSPSQFVIPIKSHMDPIHYIILFIKGTFE
jgi:hypothetical protein